LISYLVRLIFNLKHRFCVSNKKTPISP